MNVTYTRALAGAVTALVEAADKLGIDPGALTAQARQLIREDPQMRDDPQIIALADGAINAGYGLALEARRNQSS